MEWETEGYFFFLKAEWHMYTTRHFRNRRNNRISIVLLLLIYTFVPRVFQGGWWEISKCCSEETQGSLFTIHTTSCFSVKTKLHWSLITPLKQDLLRTIVITSSLLSLFLISPWRGWHIIKGFCAGPSRVLLSILPCQLTVMRTQYLNVFACPVVTDDNGLLLWPFLGTQNNAWYHWVLTSFS